MLSSDDQIVDPLSNVENGAMHETEGGFSEIISNEAPSSTTTANITNGANKIKVTLKILNALLI
jgi:hypothetical protein